MPNNTIDEKIKSYEALMHRVLMDFNIKENYEDFLQEMRIVVWKALVNDNPKTMYIENGNTKFTTYLYRIMSNRLIDIFKVEYKIMPKKKTKDEKEAELTEEEERVLKEEEEITEESQILKEKGKRSLAHPRLIEDMSYKQQINVLQNLHDANSIRLKVDIATFCDTLNNLDKKLWKLNLEGWTQEEMAELLAEIGIKRNRTTISRRLKTMNDKFIKYIQEGEM